jgi:hypothetical protein
VNKIARQSANKRSFLPQEKFEMSEVIYDKVIEEIRLIVCRLFSDLWFFAIMGKKFLCQDVFYKRVGQAKTFFGQYETLFEL